MFSGKITPERLNDKNFWERMAPDLHVQNDDVYSNSPKISINPALITDANDRILTEGYFDILEPNHNFNMTAMADVIKSLVIQDVPPVFAFVYDEFWSLFHFLHPLVGQIIGQDYFRLPDFWAWHIDPKTSESGFKPHRDKGPRALFEDGTPKSLTVWIPLTDANPLNGCMYIVPANLDPLYKNPVPGPLSVDLQNIRALPGKAGSLFIWNQAVLHWGARSSSRAEGPRISIAMEFQSSSVPVMNSPISRPSENLSLKMRLKLISKQILQYQHMYTITPAIEKWAQNR
jgi:hypothetical protein